ncbi:MAG: Mth938-like domain-containing protein [Gammaproteobacteria bacterium]|jgi:hypothetical protein
MEISDYQFGAVTVNGRTYTSDVIITSDHVTDNWWREQGHNLSIRDLDKIIAAKPDVVVIGTGFYGRMQVPSETVRYLEEQGMEVHYSDSQNAVAEFNRLQQQCANIVAALHLTC